MTTQRSSSVNTHQTILDVIRQGNTRRTSESGRESFTAQPALEGVFNTAEQATSTVDGSTQTATETSTASSQPEVYLTPFSAPALAALASAMAQTMQASDTGRVTSSGAPDIRLSGTPQATSLGYTGPAALNPYFTSPENPLRAGFVTGFEQWFSQVEVHSAVDGRAGYTVNSRQTATAEGAAEALRLIQTQDPGAQCTEYRFGAEGGPYAADGVTREITLSDGTRLNAGNVLNYYYYGGAGVTAGSDQMLTRLISQEG